MPRAARREAVARDGMRCSFVSEDGRRCEEIGFLEFDHVVPVALGGEASADGVRVLCRWQAVAASRGAGTVEERMRAALTALASIDASRGRGARSQAPRGDAARGSAALPAEAGP